MRRLLPIIALASLAVAAGTRPKVRAITAFIDLDSKSETVQVEDAAKFLSGARDAFRAAGFDVETIRIVTQPFPRYTNGMKREEAVALLRKFDDLAGKLGFAANIGPAMLANGDSPAPLDLLAEILATTRINASLVTAGTDGIYWKNIREAARLIKKVAAHSPNGKGNLNFAATAMLKPQTPFFPGAYHLNSGHSFAIGLEGANVVTDVFAQYHDPVQAEERLAQALERPLKEAETIATKIAASSGWTYAGIDPTPAPLGEVSIGRAIENFTGAPFGSSGTMTAAGIITRAVQSVPVKRLGYAGLMVPVLEDNLLAKRWAEGTFNMDSLLAYSAVCATGLDTIPLPGDITEERLARILGDVAALAYKWQKPLAARLLPVPGKKAGDLADFGDSRMTPTVVR